MGEGREESGDCVGVGDAGDVEGGKVWEEESVVSGVVEDGV